MIVLVFLIVRVAAAAAQTPPARPTPAVRWTVTEEQRYGNRPGADLADPRTIAVDGAGRLYVADSRPAEVKVFAPDGSLLRTLGREGGGPGEYRRPWIAARGGVVVIHDPAQQRTTVYDTSARYLRSWPSYCCHQDEIAIDRRGRIVVPAVLQPPAAMEAGGPQRAGYVRYGADGRVIDTIRIRGNAPEKLWTVARQGSDGKPSGGMTSVVIPYTPRQLFAWHPDGGFVAGWSAEMRLFRSTGRDSTSVVSAAASRQRIPESMRRAAADSAIAQFTPMVGAAAARGAVHTEDVPGDAPAFTRLLVDEEGNIWTRQLLGAVKGSTAFRVFGPTGADLGVAMVPVVVPEWGGVAFGPGTMFVRTEDADGQPIVVRLRIRRDG